MIDSRITTSKPRAGEELRFTRTTVILLLLGAMVMGAAAGAVAASLLLRAGPREITQAPSRNTGVSYTSAIQTASVITVSISKLQGPTNLATPAAVQPRAAIGSGIVLDSAGHILTTTGVVGGLQSVLVTFSDGRTARGNIVGKPDAQTGIAVFKVSATVPGEPTFARKFQEGDPVIAIGTSLRNMDPTVDVGVISALGHQDIVKGGRDLDNLILTDAGAPEGGEGGPLVDARGEIVGITLAGATSRDGWSIVLPAVTVQEVGARLVRTGGGATASLGALWTNLSAQRAQQYGLSQAGALITVVFPASPAQKAGLAPGDLVTSLNGEVITEQKTLGSLLVGKSPNKQVLIRYIRRGKLLQGKALLTAKQPTPPTPAPAPSTP